MNEKIRESFSTRAKKYGGYLCHYTSREVALKIFENREIWLGCTGEMNDKSEIMFFVKRLEDETKQIPEIDPKRRDDFFTKIYSRIETEYPFAFCMSRKYDDAAQWERYGNGAKGCCLVIDIRSFLEATYDSISIFNEVFYEHDITEHEHFSTVVNYLATGELYGYSNEKGLVDNILLCSYIRKHQSFESEGEVRWSNLWKRTIDGSHIIDQDGKKYMSVSLDYLCKKNNVKFESLFQKVILGPKAEICVGDFKTALVDIGLLELAEKVVSSDCPLR